MSAALPPLTPAAVLEIRKFVAPEIVSGLGALELAGRYARNLGVRHALLVSDAGVIAAGWQARVRVSLQHAGVAVTTFDGISPNPRTSEVMRGADAYRKGGCDGLVVVGGGSPIDAAKAVALKDVQEDPDRLRRPLRRTASGWAEVSWNDAIEEAGWRVLRVMAEDLHDGGELTRRVLRLAPPGTGARLQPRPALAVRPRTRRG